MCLVNNLAIVVILLPICFVYGQSYYKGDKGNKCSLKNGKSGVCRLITDCPEAIAGIKKGVFPEHCGFEGTQVIACCPTTTSSIERKPGVISKEKCIEYAKYVWSVELNPTLFISGSDIRRNECPFLKQELVVGGQPAYRREFPHMCHLGYESSDGIRWACGGSLISELFVLTAAHCLSDRSLGDVKYARMGIIDLDNNDNLQEFNVTEIIPYPEYEEPSHYHDIGLARLDRKAALNTFVRPACLYTNNHSPWSKVIASGWGKTDFAGPESNVLLRVVLELYDQPTCNKTFRQQVGTNKLREGIKDNLMICAGHSKDLKDTCQGDSGGPLQVYNTDSKNLSCMYNVVGVISFGKACGLATNIPAVYTRVSYYIKWIENIVWPLKQ